MHGAIDALAVLGAIKVVHWGVKTVVTVIDIGQRWLAARNGDPNAWN
jgi:hypothetical protein